MAAHGNPRQHGPLTNRISGRGKPALPAVPRCECGDTYRAGEAPGACGPRVRPRQPVGFDGAVQWAAREARRARARGTDRRIRARSRSRRHASHREPHRRAIRCRIRSAWRGTLRRAQRARASVSLPGDALLLRDWAARTLFTSYRAAPPEVSEDAWRFFLIMEYCALLLKRQDATRLPAIADRAADAEEKR